RRRCRLGCTEFVLPISKTTGERFVNCMDNRFTNSIWIAKPNFAFGRMHVHVHRAWIHFQEQEGDWILPFHQRSVITLPNRAGNNWAFNRPPVYKHELLRTRLPAQPSSPD